MANKDSLGDRMKDYESRTRSYLPRRTYTLLRLDGKAFHTYTRGFERPFDDRLVKAMNATAGYLLSNIQGARFAYVQSDEIQILLTDFAKITTDGWFDYEVQKMVSVSAAMAAAKFNQSIVGEALSSAFDDPDFGLGVLQKYLETQPASFDSRVWTVPDPIEVENAFVWRQQDAMRNAIQMVARSMYSHKECDHKDQKELLEMIAKKGYNWESLDPALRRGRFVVKEGRQIVVEAPPVFSDEKDFLRSRIPILEVFTWRQSSTESLEKNL